MIVIIGVCFLLYMSDPQGFMAIPSNIAEYFSQTTSEISTAVEETSQQRQERIERENQEFYSEIARLVFEYTNNERTKNGLKKLVWDEKLAEIARKHSEDMKENDYFSHTNLEGEGPTERAKNAGYNTYKELGGGWYSDGIGENIGKMPTGNVAGLGYVANTPDAVAEAQVHSWMESEGHRANILDSDYDKLGVGVAFDGVYYILTQDFW